MSLSNSIDKSTSMQAMLKEAKVLDDLSKGIASMKLVHPTVLQSQAIPLIKKDKKKAVVIRYAEYSGIKLTLLLPLLDKQIRYSIKENACYSLIVCADN